VEANGGYCVESIKFVTATFALQISHSRLLPNMQPADTTLTMIERITIAMADLDALDVA
jgi:hypothetical protein